MAKKAMVWLALALLAFSSVFLAFAEDTATIHGYSKSAGYDYVLFGTGVMACLRVLRDPSEENVTQYRMVVDALGGREELIRFLMARFPRALLTLPQKAMQEIKWRIG